MTEDFMVTRLNPWMSWGKLAKLSEYEKKMMIQKDMHDQQNLFWITVIKESNNIELLEVFLKFRGAHMCLDSYQFICDML